MSSFTRTIQRKVLRAADKYVGAPTATQCTDKGYRVLRPTRGWFTVSTRRVAAQHIMRAKYGFVR